MEIKLTIKYKTNFQDTPRCKKNHKFKLPFQYIHDLIKTRFDQTKQNIMRI